MSVDAPIPIVPDLKPPKGRRGPRPKNSKEPNTPWEDDGHAPGFGSFPGENGNIRIAYHKPGVAKHVARVLIQNNMDYEAAATALMKDREVSQSNIVNIARSLETAPQIQKALQDILRGMGYDEEANKTFMAVLWHAILDKHNDKRWPSAMKIYSEIAGIAKKAGQDKPAVLPLEGVEEGLKRMGLEREKMEEEGEMPELEEEE